MNASKETAQKALRDLENAADLIDGIVGDDTITQQDYIVQDIKRRLASVQTFLETAKRKLPYEAAYDRDRSNRRKARA